MLTVEDKLAILTDAAKYDAACTSSGVDRDAKLGHLGSTNCAGICHSFAADGRCITLLKVLMTNACIYDCAYCANRCSNDIPRAMFEPRELADLTIEFYRRNYIEGLFLSSGVIKSPDFTMELMMQAIAILRNEYGFLGYIHVKAIPGASPEALAKLGFLVDRMSTNIELPSQDSLTLLAPSKTKSSILAPMDFIAQGIMDGPDGVKRRLSGNVDSASSSKKSRPFRCSGHCGSCGACAGRQRARRTSSKSATTGTRWSTGDGFGFGGAPVSSKAIRLSKQTEIERYEYKERFVPAGQSTQMIIGATPESDYHILRLSNSLYSTFGLRRVFFSAYMPINESSILPDKGTYTPLDREHRLYQADWLMRFYNFGFDEIISESNPFLDTRIDPKANWALNNIHLFPIEINTAPYWMLMRIPGLGVTGAQKVVRARKCAKLSFDSLKRMGLSTKRMKYFITCNGKYSSPVPFDVDAIRACLILDATPAAKQNRCGGKRQVEGQLSLFNPATLDMGFLGEVVGEAHQTSAFEPFQSGQLKAFQEQSKLLGRLKAEKEAKHELICA